MENRTLNMTYNSQREKLVISEYGRNIQKLIKYAKTIEDKDEQQAFLDEVVELMKKMKIGNKKSDEYTENIWIHVYRIADFDLKAVPPGGVIPTPKPDDFKPGQLDYPEEEKHFRHYGHHIHNFIEKAIAMEDGVKKDQFIATIGSYMKLAYITWSSDDFVNDRIIKHDLKKMSKEKLIFPKGYSLDTFIDKDSNKNKSKRKFTGGKKSRKKK